MLLERNMKALVFGIERPIGVLFQMDHKNHPLIESIEFHDTDEPHLLAYDELPMKEQFLIYLELEKNLVGE